MNEVKQNSNEEEAARIAKDILSLTILDQNEIFVHLRKILCESRSNYINEQKEKWTCFGKDIEFAEESFKTVFLAEMK